MKIFSTMLLAGCGFLATTNVFANSLINATAIVTPSYVLHIDGYVPCQAGQYPLKDAFGKEAISIPSSSTACFNGSCTLDFKLGAQNSIDYYESNGTSCVKKTANENTPGFKKTYLAKVSFAYSLFPDLMDDPSYPEGTAQHGTIEGRGTVNNDAFVKVSYTDLPKFDQIIWDDKTINVTFQ